MAILPVLKYPDARLRIPSKPVEVIDDALQVFMDDMYDTMIAEEGCGLAAPQVGVHKRVIVIDFSYQDPAFKPLFMVNPEIIWKSDETMMLNEGCLSVNEGTGPVKRSHNVRVRYLNRAGQNVEQEMDQTFACAVQHEIDHLNGILFIDHLSSLRRQMLLNKKKRMK